MEGPRLRTGLLGLAGMGQLVLQAICQDDRYQIVAIADRDTRLLRRLVSQFDCYGFDDFRQFVINSNMDCLVVCEGLHRCIDHIRLAIERGIHLLRLTPMGRSLIEARELANAAEKAGVRYDVLTVAGCSQWVDDLFRTADIEGHASCYLVRGILEQAPDNKDQEAVAWMRDMGLAGGGVVLYQGYSLLAQLIHYLGIPSKVYCQTCQDRPGKASVYMAEDAVVLYCRFPSGCVLDMTMIRHWDWDRSDLRLTMYLPDRQLSLIDHAITVTDKAGIKTTRPVQPIDPLMQIKAELSAYALSFIQPLEQPFAGSAKAHLQVMAVIQAAYISAQTGCPEGPSSLL